MAKHVGVSQATVSRVLNDKPGISDATRAAVLSALDVLGYERPAKLRGDRARLVGLILPEMHDPIYPALAEIIAGALAKRGFSPVLCPRAGEDVTEADYLEILADQHVSGIIFASGAYQYTTANHDQYAALRDRSLPVVLMNATIPGLELPTVSTDDEHALEQAYGHLAALGHQRIALLLGPHDHIASLRKLAAYRALLPAGADHGLVLHAGFTMQEGQAAATTLLQSDATAIICATDALALGAVRAAKRAGRQVPADVSIVGFDDSTLMTHTDPPLTTIRQPAAAMGQAAVALLLAQIDGDTVSADEMLFEPELVVRSSTGPAPAPARKAPAKPRR